MMQMWSNSNMMGFFGWTMMIAFWAVLAVLVVWAIRSMGTTRSVEKSDAVVVLERRYAAGEIDRKEFEERRQVLASHLETGR